MKNSDKYFYRTTEKVQLCKAIESYVSRHYDPKKAMEIVKKCEALDEARKELISLKHSEDAQMHKSLLIFYYNGLRYLDSNFKFKVDGDSCVNIWFIWRDSLTGQEYFAEEGLALEMNSILFNLAAWIHNMGSTLPLTKDSVKTISMEFQNAAWIFDYMNGTLENLDSKLRGVDFRSDNLKRLQALQLAQSQYCFFKKAVMAEMKDGLICQLSRGVYKFFAEADGYVQGSLKNSLEKYCNYPITTTKCYVETYGAISNLYRAKEIFSTLSEDGSGSGLAIGHCMKASRILSSIKSDNESVQESVGKRLEESEILRVKLIEINNNVYMEAIKSESFLPEIEEKIFAIARSMEDALTKEYTQSWTKKPDADSNDVSFFPGDFYRITKNMTQT
jgi:hypothetical protein